MSYTITAHKKICNVKNIEYVAVVEHYIYFNVNNND